MCSLIRGLCVHNYTFICFLVCLCMRRGTVTPKQGSCARRENKYSFTSIGEEWARRARHQARHTGKRPTIKRKRRGSTITQTTVQCSSQSTSAKMLGAEVRARREFSLGPSQTQRPQSASPRGASSVNVESARPHGRSPPCNASGGMRQAPSSLGRPCPSSTKNASSS